MVGRKNSQLYSCMLQSTRAGALNSKRPAPTFSNVRKAFKPSDRKGLYLYSENAQSSNGFKSPRIVIWLILPVVICLSQRLSHASVSTSTHVKRNCEWLIKSVVVHLIVPVTRITVAILELIHAKSADCFGGMRAFIRPKTDLLRQCAIGDSG